MSGADPAIAAAERASLNGKALRYKNEGVAAAREALAPIRALHRPHYGMLWCREDQQRWPCQTAYLIYTREELNQR